MDVKKINLERDYLVNVELPNLINRIMKLSGYPISHLDVLKIYEEMIKNIVEIELASSINNFLSLQHTGDDIRNN